MADPRRWSDADADAPRGVRELLREVGAPPRMPPEVRAAGATKLASLGPSASPWAAGLRWFHLAGAGAVVSAAILVGLSRQAPRAVAPPAQAHAAAAPAPSAPVGSVAAREARAEARAEAPPLAQVAFERSAVTRLAPALSASAREARERRWIDLAQRALDAGRAGDALEFAHRHAREFPQGQWVEEREEVAVRALAALGRDDAARLRCARFLQRFPTGIYAPRVRRVCERLP